VVADFISNDCKQIPVFEGCTAHGGGGTSTQAFLGSEVIDCKNLNPLLFPDSFHPLHKLKRLSESWIQSRVVASILLESMDIFNRPPAISEDTLQYTLYPPPGLADRASVTSFAACIDSLVESLIPEFIWHRDPFELKVVSDPDNDGWMLEGRMRVGDCVDDEWCVVWLLKEVSKKWEVVIR